MNQEAFDRGDELLVQRATEGLSLTEDRELADLLAADTALDADRYELAAAAIQLAVTEIESMPAHVRARLDASTERAEVIEFPRPERRRWPAWLPAAAVLALAFVGWLTLRPDPVPSAADQRAELVADAPDLMRLEWTATEDPAARGAQGDVVWSNELQTGFMRFRGLAANDPSQSQYQLWVFDAERDERYPVDGGVFDVPAGEDEVVVPIDAKILVHEPSLFAVTVEEPGGVVVSSRERIVVLAQR